jgi:catechol 2,3-dioxygenase-like lactoylglutathione lyase family enzyme
LIDHVVFWVTDMARSRAFYDRALAPLGLRRITGDDHDFAGYGVPGKGYFWIGPAKETPTGTHVAFASPDRVTVHAFYAAALAAGGGDNGAPGLRPQYHPQYQKNYYGAFVLDPDGHNIEAVCYAAA